MKSIRHTTRTKQAEERRLQILRSALEVFAAQGFNGTSVQDIARTAGISTGLMYHYFAGKEALLAATVEYHSFLTQMKQILTDTRERPLTEVLTDLAGGFLKLLDSKAGLVKLFHQEINTNQDIKKAWSGLIREGVSLLQQYLDSQVAEGKLKPHHTEATARSLLGILFMYHFTQDIFDSSRLTRDDYVSNVLATLLLGIKEV